MPARTSLMKERPPKAHRLASSSNRLLEVERRAERGAGEGEVGIAVEAAVTGNPYGSEDGMALILAVLPKRGHLILNRVNRVRRRAARW